VGPVLREQLFEKTRSVIMTSATLAIGQPPRFDFYKSRIGLTGCETLRAGSPFNFREQAKLIVVRGLADPTAEKEQFEQQTIPLESPSYFKTDEPDADRMTYRQLEQYIVQLRTSGFHVVPYMVQLQRKVAFPFVTLVMTLLAVPFAVTIGRSGTLYGIGVALVLAITYWTMLSVFGAVGAGGLISPMLAAWAPNLLFGAAAMYMMLTVRT